MDQTDILIQKTKKKHTKAVNFFIYFSVLALLVLEIAFPVVWKENEIFPLWYVSIFLFSNEFALIAASVIFGVIMSKARKKPERSYGLVVLFLIF